LFSKIVYFTLKFFVKNFFLEKALLALSMQKVRDSGKIALVTSRKLLNNIVTKPEQAKYRTINLENATIKKKITIKPGGMNVLIAAGFVRNEVEQTLVMSEKDVDVVWIQSVIDQAGVVVGKLS
jgi:hypothetical protein